MGKTFVVNLGYVFLSYEGKMKGVEKSGTGQIG